MNLLLKRFPTPRGMFGCFGELFINGEFFCVTVERSWKNNEANVSCVPVGIYDFLPHSSPKHGECYALEQASLGVTRYGPSQRTHILMHIANGASELEGCIAPGCKVGVSGGEWVVINSTTAFNRLMSLLDGKPAKLEIVNV